MLDKGTFMPRTRRSKQREKGFAFIYVTLVGALLLLPMAGLAVDFGMLYNIKARLQTAVDAAAIGAGYMLHATTNIQDPTQLAAVEAAAQAYFNANYPAHYFGSTVVSYSAAVASTNSGKTITVNASATVPMLLLRVLGIQTSQVAAVAVSNVRYIAMMIVVDRSGSVVSEGAQGTIQNALSTFVATASTSYLVDGVDTVGMVSFGGAWNLDYSPSINFQTGSSKIQTAINNIPFGNSSTNTAEGLYQAWSQLYQMNLPGSLNVIVLLTDGRPSSFTAGFTPTSGPCSNKSWRGGVLEASVSVSSPQVYPFWPPTTSNHVTGLFATHFAGLQESGYLAADYTTCAYGPPGFPTGAASPNTGKVYNDFGSTFPSSVGPVDNVPNPAYTNPAGSGISTQSGYYGPPFLASGPGISMTSTRAVRYAAFNVADNMATLIRQDTTLKPMIFVIGLNYTNQTEEPLDADWLARVANDPNYVTVGSDTTIVGAGQSVYQNSQTPGMYCNSTPATLSACFAQVTSQLLRLMQ
jgi:Flp pilus assembly protein TadG